MDVTKAKDTKKGKSIFLGVFFCIKNNQMAHSEPFSYKLYYGQGITLRSRNKLFETALFLIIVTLIY